MNQAARAVVTMYCSSEVMWVAGFWAFATWRIYISHWRSNTCVPRILCMHALIGTSVIIVSAVAAVACCLLCMV